MITLLRVKYESSLDETRITQINMRQFELCEAKSGYPLCTRCGYEVKILSFEIRNDAPIIALVFNEDTKMDEPHIFYENGSKILYEKEPNDLMMKDYIFESVFHQIK